MGTKACSVSINSTSEEVRSVTFGIVFSGNETVSINSTSEEVRSRSDPGGWGIGGHDLVSINSTSEEVRSGIAEKRSALCFRFPLIQLPRKSEAFEKKGNGKGELSFH